MLIVIVAIVIQTLAVSIATGKPGMDTIMVMIAIQTVTVILEAIGAAGKPGIVTIIIMIVTQTVLVMLEVIGTILTTEETMEVAVIPTGVNEIFVEMTPGSYRTLK